MSYRTCKRCSVTRVNTLCELYRRAFHDGESKALKDLAKLSGLAHRRGYAEGVRVMHPGLTEAEVRSLCWNVSSMLEDEDLFRLGYNDNGKK